MTEDAMSKAEYHLETIPEGYQIYESHLEVAGLARRRVAASRFARGTQQVLEWEREADNPHDKNAIRIFGLYRRFFRTKRVFLGYVPRQTAKAIVEADLWRSIQPRLLKTYLSTGGFVEILFQVIGPKERIGAYKASTLTENREHYTDAVELVKHLKRERRHDDAISLLKELVQEVETEAQAAGPGWGVAPWYYEQLAILYRKERRYQDEVEILERYAKQPKAPGVGPEKLATRLEKAREKLKSHNDGS